MRYAVTGASRGIGLEFVRQLSRRGDVVEAGVLLPEENADILQALARESEGRLRVHPLDIADPASVGASAREVEGGGAVWRCGWRMGAGSSFHPSTIGRGCKASALHHLKV